MSYLNEAFSKIGLDLNPEIEQVFFSHNIMTHDDFLLLRKDDLKEMGLPIGTRNKILAYIHAERKSESRSESGFKVMELMMKSIVEISKTSQKRLCDNKENTAKEQSLQLISDMPTSLKTASKQITLPVVVTSPEVH